MIQTVKNMYHFFQAILANLWYGFPSRSLKVIGVTGTDGKTTSVHLIYHILKNNGKKVSMISTVYAQIGVRTYDTGFHTTTPNSFLIQKLLRLAVDNRDEYFVLETTSHRLDQNSLWGIEFEVSLITNITHEHLDYHKTYQKYIETKAKIISLSKITLINKDDESYPNLLNASRGGIIRTFSLKQKADYTINYQAIYTDITNYNAYNYLGVFGVCEMLGISRSQITRCIKSFKLPKGRLEMVYDEDFKIIVDFAHTPRALTEVLTGIKKKYINTKHKGKLIHVFGSAGLRDATKRFSMGYASGSYSDITILTEEDYRTESLIKICEQIGKGLLKRGFKFKKYNLLEQCDNKKYTIIYKRDEAINKSISLANKNDVIIITGKGHEQSLCRGNKEYVWNDIEYVKSLKLV